MKLKIFPPKVEIADDEGFSAEKDIFGLKQFGVGLTKLVDASDDQLVIALDGPWGIGKTTFVKMLAGHLRNEKFPVIYFDAFANDYAEDAFLTISGEIVSLIQKLKQEEPTQIDGFVQKAAAAGKIFGRPGVRSAIKDATLDGIGISNDDRKNTSDVAIDKYFQDILTKRSSEKDSIVKFQDALANTVSLISKTISAKGDAGKPLIFIIDELDRCKPPFALEIIERVKHVFAVPRIHFVLVADLQQLENSVRFSYGQETDARTYLQKFYNLIFHLPLQGQYEHEEAPRKFLEHLSKNMPTHRSAIEYLVRASKARDLSFRTIERIMTYIALAMISTSSRQREYFMPPPILTGLSIIKVLRPKFFQEAKAGTLTLKNALDTVGFDKWKTDDNSTRYLDWWRFALGEKLSDEQMKSYGQSLLRFNIDDRTRTVPIVANSIIDRLEMPQAEQVTTD